MTNPECYASTNFLQKSIVLPLIDEFADHLINMSGKCMDVGCGPGDITKNMLLPKLDPNAVIIGTDISEKMIEYANKIYGNKERLHFEILDVQTKSLPKKYISQFDQIFSFSTLMLCNDIQQAFENIYQMLRPGGIMFVSFVVTHDAFDVLKIMKQNIQFQLYVPDIKDFACPYLDSVQPRKEIKELLTKIGFQVHHCSRREKTFCDKNVDNFLSSITSVFGFLDKMPHDKLKEFKTIFTNEYIKRKIHYKPIHKNQEETLVLDLFEIVVIFAQKVM